MSSVTTGAWRRPQYVVTALTALLQNEVLHDGLVHTAEQPVQAHSAGSHDDQSAVELLVPADRFQSQVGGTFEIASSLVVWRMADAVETELAASIKLQKDRRDGGALAAVGYIVLQDAGAIAAGDLRLGVHYTLLGDGSLPTGANITPTLETIAIPAEGANPVIRFLSRGAIADALVLGATDRILRLVVRRSGGDLADTYANRIRLIGLVLNWDFTQ